MHILLRYTKHEVSLVHSISTYFRKIKNFPVFEGYKQKST